MCCRMHMTFSVGSSLRTKFGVSALVGKGLCALAEEGQRLELNSSRRDFPSLKVHEVTFTEARRRQPLD